MKRTKKRKLKRTKMKKQVTTLDGIRRQLELNVIAYHSHLVDWVTRQTNETLFTFCHPLDRTFQI